ncbi:hypothetical protein Dsin_019411 [Dipteronia sinensis]|uniref:MULE transposase domain-containing protein n=1 Tax=Dipteronia sinensis TaxID=43782 RepID=A0AAE0A739_9ROSI|nr:hypothetical protein Dsin_019411 [Dipteronia sinensis]
MTERRETNTRICWDLNKILNEEENGGDLNENIQDLVENDMEPFVGQYFLSEEDKYGDAVVFNTTYKVNSYDMPFDIFIGVNNHGKTILFECALLRNETSAFQWLMKINLAIETIEQNEAHDTMLATCKNASLRTMSM